jgi:diguanylate cyclase (GGDEF)-like protein
VVRFDILDADDEAFAEEIAQLLTLDDLTGLYLRRRFDAELELLLAHAQSQRRPCSLLVMDLDGVKAINDKHGHLFGAYTISEAGKYIGAQIELPCIACRFGGDEYIVALPDHDLQSALTVADRLRAGIASHAFVYEGTALHPGISIGVAACPTHGRTGEALFRAADAALYAAKRAGKNRVEHA